MATPYRPDPYIDPSPPALLPYTIIWEVSKYNGPTSDVHTYKIWDQEPATYIQYYVTYIFALIMRNYFMLHAPVSWKITYVYVAVYNGLG